MHPFLNHNFLFLPIKPFQHVTYSILLDHRRSISNIAFHHCKKHQEARQKTRMDWLAEHTACRSTAHHGIVGYPKLPKREYLRQLRQDCYHLISIALEILMLMLKSQHNPCFDCAGFMANRDGVHTVSTIQLFGKSQSRCQTNRYGVGESAYHWLSQLFEKNGIHSDARCQ